MTNIVWKVDGITAEKSKSRQRSKIVILSDSPAGVEWGEGNLIGRMDRGYVLSNFWLILANFKRPILGCIDAKVCK